MAENNLCPVSVLERQKIDYEKNDEKRLDGRKDSLSFSISFPNTRYLKYKMQSTQNIYCIIEKGTEEVFKVIEIEINKPNTRIKQR